MEMTESTHRRVMRQLRHEIIHFLDANNLIQDTNTAIRRWKYYALGETLVAAYPNMLWEKAQKDKKGRVKSPKSIFLSRLAEARRHRWLRKAQGMSKNKETTEASVDVVVVEDVEPEFALQELARMEDVLGPNSTFDTERVAVLLHSTLSQRKEDPPLTLPCYFLNEDILTVEAQLRFATTTDEAIRRLCKAKETVSEMCNQPMDFCDIDNYLRGAHAKSAFITLNSADAHGSPGPMIVWSSAGKCIFCAEDECVTLKDESTLEKALFLCLAVYYIKDLTYPSAFAQTLGLIQSVLVKEESFPRCWASSKLLRILDTLKNIT